MRGAAFWTLLLFARVATAAIYESPITAESEDDLIAAQDRGELSPESTERLVEVMAEGVDLNTASREQLYDLPGIGWREVDAIIEYRKLKGRIEDPAELVGVEAITADALLQMAPFLRLEAATEKLPFAGKMKLMGSVAFSDSVPPPAYFNGEFKGPWNLKAGIELITTRFRPTSPAFDPTRDTMVVSGPFYSLSLPKLYLQWKAGNRQIIAGSFKVGFAEQLTLDTTQHNKPNGFDVRSRTLQPESGLIITYGPGGNVTGVDALASPCHYSTGELSSNPCPTDKSIAKVMRDYRWREVFRGLAGSIEDLELGEHGPKLSLYGFGSLQTKAMYMYQLVDRRNCSDPRLTDAECSAPSIYVRQADPADPYPKLAYSTVPGILNELVFGGHTRLEPVPRFHFGITGYGAVPLWNVPEMQLDFQEWARTPWNGPYGAIGVDGRLTLGPIDLFTEVTRTFNRIPDEKGGWGAILRGVYNPKGHQFEASVRFYDRTFSNPYSSPVASPDLYFGQRARNEAGLHLDYEGKLPADLFVNAWINFWVLPWKDDSNGAPAGTANLHGRARVDYRGFDVLQGGVWFDYKNNDLAYSQRGTCYSGSLNNGDLEAIDFTGPQPPFDANGVPTRCFGESYRISAELNFKPVRKGLIFTAQAYQTWVDDTEHPTDFRIDRRVWLEARSNLLENRLSLRLRVNYQWFDAYGPDRFNDVFWGTFEIAGRPWAFLQPALRYDIYLFNDSRPVGSRRNPNPEQTLRLIVDAKF